MLHRDKAPIPGINVATDRAFWEEAVRQEGRPGEFDQRGDFDIPQPDTKIKVRITGKTDNPQDSYRTAYSWDMVDETTSPIAGKSGIGWNDFRATTSLNQAYERSGNARVPVDGSAVVEITASPGGNYWIFDYPEQEVLGKLLSGTGPYAWEEWESSGTGGATGFTKVVGGRSGTTLVNAAYETNNIKNLAAGTFIWLKRGRANCADCVTAEIQVGDPSTGANERQTLYITGAVGGTFTITVFSGAGDQAATTTALSYAADAAAVQTAMNAAAATLALPYTVTVSSGAGTLASPFVVNYPGGGGGAGAYLPYRLLVADPTGLVGYQEWLFDAHERRCVWGKLTQNGGAGNYGWVQMDPGPNGSWFQTTNGLSGSLTQNVAWEDNRNAGIPLGTVVRICPGCPSDGCTTTTTTTTTAAPTTTTTSTTTTLAPPCPTTTTTSTTTTSTTAAPTTTTTSTTTTAGPTTTPPPCTDWRFAYCCGGTIATTTTLPPTTTTTTVPPCTGLCTWTWNNTTRLWTLTCSGCTGKCVCQQPQLCGDTTGQTTRTYCAKGDVPGPCCGTTTTSTSGPPTTTTTGPPTTTTTTPPPPGCTGCTWKYFAAGGGWGLVKQDCLGCCGCLPVATAGADCDTTVTACVRCPPTTTFAPQPTCYGTCGWSWNGSDWVQVSNTCRGTNPLCVCDKPSIAGDACGGSASTYCYGDTPPCGYASVLWARAIGFHCPDADTHCEGIDVTFPLKWDSKGGYYVGNAIINPTVDPNGIITGTASIGLVFPCLTAGASSDSPRPFIYSVTGGFNCPYLNSMNGNGPAIGSGNNTTLVSCQLQPLCVVINAGEYLPVVVGPNINSGFQICISETIGGCGCGITGMPC